MNNEKNFVKSLIFFTIFFIGIVSAASVWTNKNSYNFGETVIIYGGGFLPTQDISIEVDNPNDVFLFSNQTSTDNNGNFTSFYIISDQDPLIMIEGTYKIYANSQTTSSQNTFSVSSSSITTTTTSTTSTTTTTTTTINSINYIEVNGTTFRQPREINITGWSGNLSSETYLWNDYNGALQLMLPTGTGIQTNITLSSNLNEGIVYNVSSNSSGNSTLSTKSFNVLPPTTTTTVEEQNNNPPQNPTGTTTTALNPTTTVSTTIQETANTEVTTAPSETTTTIYTGEKSKGIKTWYIILIVLIFIGIATLIGYIKFKKEAEEAAFGKLKQKWTK